MLLTSSLAAVAPPTPGDCLVPMPGGVKLSASHVSMANVSAAGGTASRLGKLRAAGRVERFGFRFIFSSFWYLC